LLGVNLKRFETLPKRADFTENLCQLTFEVLRQHLQSLLLVDFLAFKAVLFAVAKAH
jgi:hypothetical protein